MNLFPSPQSNMAGTKDLYLRSQRFGKPRPSGRGSSLRRLQPAWRFSPALFFTCIAAAGPIYNITDLGALGGASAQAFGLSPEGQAVGAASTMFGYTHAFSSSGWGMTDLTMGTASEGQASAVNGAGQIAGTQFIGGQAFATLWTNGAAQSVGGAGSYGTAINGAGQIAGLTTSDGQGHAFRTVNGVVQDLGTLPGGTWSSAYSINDAGRVAGYGDTGAGVFRAFVWSPEAGYVMLGTFGGASSYAMAINPAGQVAGSAQVPGGYGHAFLWSGNGLVDLGTLGGESSYAYGVNEAGEVVGYSWLNGVTHAFLFEDGVILDLNSLIDSSSGWLLTEAYAINGSGQIAGAGIYNGVEHAFRLDVSSVPEPVTWMVVLGGLSVFAAFRFRSALRPRRRRPVPRRARRRSVVWPE